MTKKYGTPTAFRTALEGRLNNFSKKHGIDLYKLRRQVAFDRLLCRLFIRFPMDVVVSSMVLEPIEEIGSQNWLDFAGIETMPFPAISREQQFAEKFHAYTLPREESENSRVKDLIDLALLIEYGSWRDIRISKDSPNSAHAQSSPFKLGVEVQQAGEGMRTGLRHREGL